MTQFKAAPDVAAVVSLLESTGLRTDPHGPQLESTLREFATDCLDAVDTGGHYRDCSDLARRVGRGELGPEVLLEARRARSGGAPGALSSLNNYHRPGAALLFLALGVLSDTATEAVKTAARMASLYRGFTLIQGLEGNPLKGHQGSCATIWAPWCDFVRRHHDLEQAEIDRAARELAADLVTRLRPLLPLDAALPSPEPDTTTDQWTLQPVCTTNLVPFPTGDIALDVINRDLLREGRWWVRERPARDAL